MRFAVPCLLVALLCPPALAQRIAVAPFTGPGANGARTQVVSGLCDLAECVPEKKVTTGGKPDWKKAKKEKVSFIVAGKVTAKGKKKTLELRVETKAKAPKLKKSFPLENGQLSEKNLSAATEALGKAMGLKKKEAPPPEEEKKPPPEETKPPPEEKKPPPSEEKKPPPEEKKPEQKQPDERKPEKKAPPAEAASEAAPPESPTTQTKRPVFAVEVGFDVQGKTYSYSGVATSNLRSYKAPFIGAPDLKAEVYPIALATQGFLAGLGLELGFSFSLGLKSKKTNAAGTPEISYPTQINRLDVALKFQIRPLDNSDAYFAPFIGFRSHSFTLGVGSDGSALDGLPPITYSALKFGVAGEVPFANTGLLAFARFAVLPVLSLPDIVGTYVAPRTTFFASGSALGIDFSLGLGLKLPPLPSLQVRLGFDFARYGLSFKTAATDTYRADGAVDLYLGGNLALRFSY